MSSSFQNFYKYYRLKITTYTLRIYSRIFKITLLVFHIFPDQILLLLCMLADLTKACLDARIK